MAAIIQGIPSLAVPFVRVEDLTLTIPWFQFLQSIWQRTGGGTGAFFISEINTGTGLTGGPANAGNPITTFTLASAGDKTLLSNISGGAAVPIPHTLTAILDNILGATQGDIIYRGSSTWAVLAPGTSGNFLKTQGAGANPIWASASFGSAIANNDILSNISGGSATPIGNTLTAIIDSAIDNTQGDILYRNASAWVHLAPGTSGQYLQTQGSAANPRWHTVTGSTTFTSTAQTITSAGGLTLAHGLSAAPTVIQLYLVNVTTELGYVTSDQILIAPGFHGVTNEGIAVWPDATNINIRFGSATNVFSYLNKTTGASGTLTNANWTLTVYAQV